MSDIPPAEVSLDSAVVSELVRTQCPQLIGRRQLRWFAHGWDNELFALGEDLLVRLPRRSAAVPLITNEAAALPEFAAALPVPVPAPVFIGSPGHGYPWPWLIVPRLPGRLAADVPVPDRQPAAAGLARFFTALHRPASANAPQNRYRGVGLATREETWLPLIERAAGPIAADRWRQVADGPAWTGPPLWLHGDPHPLNLLLGDTGELSAVIDFGDVCAGDPASDLATAWLTFDTAGRRQLQATYQAPGATGTALWHRSWAWHWDWPRSSPVTATISHNYARLPNMGCVKRWPIPTSDPSARRYSPTASCGCPGGQY